MPSENEGKRNPLVRQRMYVQGLAPAPLWENVDLRSPCARVAMVCMMIII